MEYTLIGGSSPFSVRFEPCQPQFEEVSVAKDSIQFLGKITCYAIWFFANLPRAAFDTAKLTGRTFRAVYRNPHNQLIWNPATLLVNLIFVFPDLICSVPYRAHCLAHAKVFSTDKEFSIANWALDAHLNLAHLVRCNKPIDMSEIGDEVKIDQLIGWFDAGNYDEADLKDDGTRKTRGELKKQLETFVAYVHSRTPFLGTPPAYDVIGLEKFYKKIEDQVRVCIHRAKNDPNTQKIIALDFAVAGGHCGARYMATAVDCYSRASLDSLDATTPLEQTILQWLGNMRRGIALNQAAGLPNGATHGLPQYLRDFGEVLGLPGTEDVTEQILSARLDSRTYIPQFFAKYTEKEIVRELLKVVNDPKNTVLLHQILDWVKDHMGSWGETREGLEKAIVECQEYLANDVTDAARGERLFNRMLNCRISGVDAETVTLVQNGELQEASLREYYASYLSPEAWERRVQALKGECQALLEREGSDEAKTQRLFKQKLEGSLAEGVSVRGLVREGRLQVDRLREYYRSSTLTHDQLEALIVECRQYLVDNEADEAQIQRIFIAKLNRNIEGVTARTVPGLVQGGQIQVEVLRQYYLKYMSPAGCGLGINELVAACQKVLEEDKTDVAQMRRLFNEMLNCNVAGITAETLIGNGLIRDGRLQDEYFGEYYSKYMSLESRKIRFYEALGVTGGTKIPESVLRWVLISNNVLTYGQNESALPEGIQFKDPVAQQKARFHTWYKGELKRHPIEYGAWIGTADAVQSVFRSALFYGVSLIVSWITLCVYVLDLCMTLLEMLASYAPFLGVIAIVAFRIGWRLMRVEDIENFNRAARIVPNAFQAVGEIVEQGKNYLMTRVEYNHRTEKYQQFLAQSAIRV